MIGIIEHKVKFIRLSALSGAGKATSHLPENVLEVPLNMESGKQSLPFS